MFGLLISTTMYVICRLTNSHIVMWMGGAISAYILSTYVYKNS